MRKKQKSFFGPEPYYGDKPYIFVSYAHKNADDAMEIIEGLKKEGYRVWFDEGIDPGTEWDEFIAERIELSGFFIALLSKEYMESSNCKDELNYARDLEKPRLLIYLEDIKLPGGMQMRLGRIQNIHRYKYKDQELFNRKLFRTKGLDNCHQDIRFVEETEEEKTIETISDHNVEENEKDGSTSEFKDIYIISSSKNLETVKHIGYLFQEYKKNVINLAQKDYSNQDTTNNIDNSDVVIVLLTKESQESPFVIKEIEKSINQNKLVIPFQIEPLELRPIFRYMFSNISIIDASQEVTKGYENLLNILRITPESPIILPNELKNYNNRVIGLEKERIDNKIKSSEDLDLIEISKIIEDSLTAPENLYLISQITKESETVISRLLKEKDANEYNTLYLAKLYELVIKDNDKAQKLFNELSRSNDPEILRNYIEFLIRTDRNKSEQVIRRIVQMYENQFSEGNFESGLKLSEFYFELGEVKEAIRWLEDSIHLLEFLEKLSSDIMIRIGNIYEIFLSDKEKSKEWYQKSFEQGNLKSIEYLAGVISQDEAEKLLLEYKKDQHILFILAKFYLKQRRKEKALPLLLESLKRNLKALPRAYTKHDNKELNKILTDIYETVVLLKLSFLEKAYLPKISTFLTEEVETGQELLTDLFDEVNFILNKAKSLNA